MVAMGTARGRPILVGEYADNRVGQCRKIKRLQAVDIIFDRIEFQERGICSRGEVSSLRGWVNVGTGETVIEQAS
jgi:hypothetical protein